MGKEDVKETDQEVGQSEAANASHIVMADSVKAEEVPTILIKDLQTISSLQPEVSVHSVASTTDVSIPVPLVVQPAEYRRSIGEWTQIWSDGMRPAYLVLALMPALLGSVLAWSHTVTSQKPLGIFHWTHFLAMLAALFFLQIGANLLNDYYDYLRGIDAGNPLGPGGLIQQGLIKPARVLLFGLTLLALGGLIGLFAALRGGSLPLLFGLAGVLCAFFYSATPRALSSLALGELVSFCLFGPLITLGAYMVQVGGTPPALFSVFVYSLLPGFFALTIIHTNNIRDIEGDHHARKYTLAVFLGTRWSKPFFALLLLTPYALVIALGLPPGAPHLLLIALWTLPGMVVAMSGMLRTDIMAALHIVMRQVLRLEVFFMLLLVVALIISALTPVLSLIPNALIP